MKKCKHLWDLAGFYTYDGHPQNADTVGTTEVYFECSVCLRIKIQLFHAGYFSYYINRRLIPDYWERIGHSRWFPSLPSLLLQAQGAQVPEEFPDI